MDRKRIALLWKGSGCKRELTKHDRVTVLDFLVKIVEQDTPCFF